MNYSANTNYTIPSTDSLVHRAAETSRTLYTPYRGIRVFSMVIEQGFFRLHQFLTTFTCNQ